MTKKIISNEANDKKASSLEGKFMSTTFIIFVSSIGLTAIFLLFPSYNNLSIFSKGEFIYIESLGIFLFYLLITLLIQSFISKKFSLIQIKHVVAKYTMLIITIGIHTFIMLIVILNLWIRFEVKTQCQNATREYNKHCVESLIYLVKDNGKNYKARNNAIWTLGQLGDKRSLPVLQSLYTGVIPNREPLDKGISQYELKKAIHLVSSGTNFFAIFWRHGIEYKMSN